MLSRSGVLRHSWGYMVGKGVRDVLGWSGEDFLGKGLGGIVEESSQDVLGVSRDIDVVRGVEQQDLY